jgi:hypothetical protein
LNENREHNETIYYKQMPKAADTAALGPAGVNLEGDLMLCQSIVVYLLSGNNGREERPCPGQPEVNFLDGALPRKQNIPSKAKRPSTGILRGIAEPIRLWID